MSLSTQSATPSGKSIAASALRGAGLIDRDSTMRDATDTAGGRKGRIRSTRATRLLDINKDRPLGTRTVNITTHFCPLLTGRALLQPLAGSCRYLLFFPPRNTS